MNEIPEPLSPLPLTVEQYEHEGLACFDLRDASGEVVVGIACDDAPVWARPDLTKADADYIVWAANNARALYEALEKLTTLCKHASKDAFGNGVTDATGAIDEGDVRAGEWIHQAAEALNAAKQRGQTGAAYNPAT